MPVIANALAEISHSTSTSIASHASGEIEQRLEDILQRSQNSISQSLESASLEIGAAVTKSLSGTLERYLARLTISQAEQGDAIEQIKEVLLAEQMKREESTTRMETQMQSIRSHLDRAVNVQPVWTPGRSPQAASIGNTMNVSSDQNIQSLKNGETQEHIARPTTPSEAYEDMFLHTLQRDPDPLVRLVDMAPPGRMDRVLPYDGAPLVTAPAFMALCLRLAQEFDNGLTTLDERNGRVRLAWILSCLRASKWSKANPLHAPYLPRVFTQVMHSLNLRKQRLHSQEDRELVERVLRAADELSGLR